MAKKKTQRDPFEVKLSPDRESELVNFLCFEIDEAEAARSRIVGDNQRIDRAHQMYEGQDRLTKDTPWPDCANLGSFIITEKVDALEASIVATLFADPVWIVEGAGTSAEKAPFVEAFMQWKSEQAKLQTFLARVTHNSLIEGTGVLKVHDKVVKRGALKKIRALLQMDPDTGQIVMDETGMPIPVLQTNGKFAEAEEGEGAIDMVIRDVTRTTNGPAFRVLSLKNFFVLPGHAAEREDIWGYVEKIYKRLPDLECKEHEGFYKNVDKLTRASDRQQTPQEQRSGVDIPSQFDRTAEKEIYECTLLMDLDDDGYEEWYVVTLSKVHRTLLRVQYQDFGTPHYIMYTPFPRPNSVYGYSYAIDKMGSLYDENAAHRNMFADRSALATNAPIMQVEGGLWDPAAHPWAPGARIPVRDVNNELKQFEVKDVPNSVITALQMDYGNAERLSGQSDATAGVTPQQDRTLGEVQMVAQRSFNRINANIKNFQEGMEDLFDLILMIWRNKLEEEPEPMPGELVRAMLERGSQMEDGEMITADMLRGVFRGKPHGSVESADFKVMRGEFAQMMTALTQLAQAVPALGAHLNNPVVIRSIVSQIARVYNWPDRANLVATFTGMMPMQPGMDPMMQGGQPGQPQPPGQQAPMQGAPPNSTPAYQ